MLSVCRSNGLFYRRDPRPLVPPARLVIQGEYKEKVSLVENRQERKVVESPQDVARRQFQELFSS